MDDEVATPIPSSLIERLNRENTALSESLATNEDLPTVTAQAKNYASRRLLSMTPKALSTLDRCMSPEVDEKVQLSAASEVLKRSPAIESSEISDTATVALSKAAITLAFSNLAKLFGKTEELKVAEGASCEIVKD